MRPADPARAIVHRPTPLEPLPRLTEDLGGRRIWIKRDDCTGLVGGGNKARKLERLVADAVGAGATVLLTSGAPQSNHARQTAGAAAMAGLRCELLLVDGVPDTGEQYLRSGNLLLDRLAGARVTLLPAGSDGDRALSERATELRSRGERPYVIPVGGSNVVGASGYVDAAAEILDQLTRGDITVGTVVHASGSGGTQAGLATGLSGWSHPPRLVGVSVGSPAAEMIEQKIAPLVDGLRASLGITTPPLPLEVDDRYVGREYGVPTAEGNAAVRRLAETEGILLDPVYTGKAMAALIDLVRADDLPPGDVLFLHTGGWPALFAYADALDTAGEIP